VRYDLQVWSPAPLDLGDRLPDPDRWDRAAADTAVYRAAGWAITAAVAQPKLPTRVPPGVREHLPDARHRIDLTIDLDAPGVGYSFLVQAAQALARGRNALCYDPQSHTVLVHTGAHAQPGAGQATG
jgi:hypothetical protein